MSPAADEQDELRELADDLLEDAMELRGWWEDWKKDEPRRGYAEEYRALCQRIDRGLRLLRPEMAERDES